MSDASDAQGPGPDAVALEARVVELEVRIAYQDQVIADLDEVVRQFTERVDALDAELRSAREAITKMRETGPANDPPPHY